MADPIILKIDDEIHLILAKPLAQPKQTRRCPIPMGIGDDQIVRSGAPMEDLSPLPTG
jgi:hypothetical protein